MFTARDIMVPEIRYVYKNTSIRDASIRILNEGIGSLIVVDENKSPMGIITKRDIIRAIVFEKLDPETTSVEKIMAKPLITIDASASIDTVIDTMFRYNITHLPVEENRTIIGIISDFDLMEVLIDLINIVKNKIA